MLEIDNIHTYYGATQVLWGISLKVEKGHVVALLGRNGAGKTTIIHSIIGFNPPEKGQIIFKGRDATKLKEHKIPQLGIGLVPQGRRIFPSLSVMENLTMAARTSKRASDWNLDKVYSFFPILKERAKQSGSLLSGGEQQMLAIARALMTNPELLLMDEPSEGLAPLIVRELSDIIKQLQNSGLSILLVEQNLNLALAVSDYTYVVDKGRIVYEATPKDLECNEEIKTRYLCVSKRTQ